MSRMKKIWLWYVMFNKRLMHKVSYLVLLCLIPLLIPLTNLAMQQDSGIMTIVLCSEDADADAVEIIEEMMAEDGVILYKRVNTEAEAVAAVQAHEADAAWVFAPAFGERVDAYTADKNAQPFITVYEREETIPLQLAHEKLVGAVYKRTSLGIYKDFVQTQVLDRAVPESEIEAHYEKYARNRDIVTTEYLNDTGSTVTLNYLTAPLRGILSMLVMLCGFAAVLYFLKDQAEGKYDWMSTDKRSIPAFASCFSAIVLAALAVFIALHFSGIALGFFRELLAMLLFVVAATGLCLCFCILFRSVGKFGALIPGLLIAMLVLSPIFFNLQQLRGVQLLLPTYYYLKAIYEPIYCLYMLIYCIGIYALAVLLNMLLHGARARN